MLSYTSCLLVSYVILYLCFCGFVCHLVLLFVDVVCYLVVWFVDLVCYVALLFPGVCYVC